MDMVGKRTDYTAEEEVIWSRPMPKENLLAKGKALS